MRGNAYLILIAAVVIATLVVALITGDLGEWNGF